MTVKDVIFAVCRKQAEQALADVQLITEEKLSLTDDYVQTFFDKMVTDSAIELRDDSISIVNVNGEKHDCMDMLNEDVNAGFWVYFADNAKLNGSVHILRWYPSKEIANSMCEVINTMGLFDTAMIIDIEK